MERLKHIIMLALTFFIAISALTWVMSLVQTQESGRDSILSKCPSLAVKIKRSLQGANFCLNDNDCRAVPVNCPWGEKLDGCYYTLINKNHSIALAQKDIYLFRNCIAEHEQTKQEYGYCQAHEQNCPDFEKMVVKCIDRKCTFAQ